VLVMEKGQVKGREEWKPGAKVTFSCELLQRGLVIDTKGEFGRKKHNGEDGWSLWGGTVMTT
jgi:hypothetical protein